ncbi:MAG: VOC family protein [Candidatus Velamenicoccus archaeovorus]
MDKVVHFEIPVDDLERAKGFYASVFGWGVQTLEEMDYTIAMTTAIDQQTQVPLEPGAVNGGIMRRTDATPAPVITIQVGAIDEALKRVEAEGGGTVRPCTEIPGMGAFAYFKDSEGNVLGLWETA